MPDLLPISVQILTFNSEATLRQALESVPGCAEVLVIDGGSSDGTVAIAESCGAHVVSQREAQEQGMPLTDFAAARNRGLAQASQPWILNLDSDETISPELLAEIAAIVHSEGQPAAYWMPRRYRFPDGTIVTLATTYPNQRIYFFHRDAVERWIKPVHEKVRVKPGFPTYRLRHPSLATLGTVEEFRHKNVRYLKIEAQRLRGEGWGPWIVRIVRTIRSRTIAMLKLAWIWLLPHRGVRLPMRYEKLRFWYAWRLIVETRPWRSDAGVP